MVAGEDEDGLGSPRSAAGAARIAPPVPSGSGWTTVSVPSGRPAEMSCCGETIAATRPAPASRAARIGQATIGRPQTGCSIFGSERAHAGALAGRHDQDQRRTHPGIVVRTGRARAALRSLGFRLHASSRA